MSRSYEAAAVITLPVLTIRAAHALAQSLLSAAGGKPPALSKKAYDRLVARVAELVKGASAGNVSLETTESGKDVDRSADHIHVMQRQWLGALAGFDVPENVLREVAQRLLETWYGDGPFYAGSTHAEQWAQTETRLAAVDTKGMEGDYVKLGGAPFLEALRRVHVTYGQVNGITAELQEAPEEIAIRPLADNVRQAIREYVYKVGASVEPDEPETAALAARLLRPYTEWGTAPRSSGAPAQPAVPENPAPPTPVTELPTA